MTGGMVAGGMSWRLGAVTAGLLLLLLAFGLSVSGVGASGAVASTSSSVSGGIHVGVASCSGSTCHGRNEADGKIVRQDELLRWQEPSSPTGAHSRAGGWRTAPRGQVTPPRLGIGSAASAPMCLGCHADPAYGGKG